MDTLALQQTTSDIHRLVESNSFEIL